MAEKYKIKKVTDFPEASTLDGFYAFGTDGSNNSVKVPIGMSEQMVIGLSEISTSEYMHRENRVKTEVFK